MVYPLRYRDYPCPDRGYPSDDKGYPPPSPAEWLKLEHLKRSLAGATCKIQEQSALCTSTGMYIPTSMKIARPFSAFYTLQNGPYDRPLRLYTQGVDGTGRVIGSLNMPYYLKQIVWS